MEPWLLLSLRIGAFGFLKEFRPEDPYITQYLVGPVMNFTQEQVNQEVYPIATYVGMLQIIFVFLLTDFLRYKPIIIVNALCGVISQSILIWCRSLRAIQVMEVFYATMTACEIAYYTYIYAKVEKEHYQRVTSHMRAAALTGRFASATTSQLVLSLGLLSIADLNHLTLAGMCCALVCALLLPSMRHSLYFHRKSIDADSQSQRDGKVSDPPSKYREAATLLLKDFKDAYTNPYVLKLSLWVALATCGYNQMMTYVQLLWVDIGGKQQISYNGAVEAVYTILSALSALLFGRVNANWIHYGETLLGLLTLLQGAVLLLSSITQSMIVGYTAYVVFGMLHNIMLVVTNSEVARYLNQDSYALIFGVNTFVALILQTFLTMVVADEGGLAFSIRHQFMVYGGYFAFLGGIYLIKGVFTLLCNR